SGTSTGITVGGLPGSSISTSTTSPGSVGGFLGGGGGVGFFSPGEALAAAAMPTSTPTITKLPTSAFAFALAMWILLKKQSARVFPLAIRPPDRYVVPHTILPVSAYLRMCFFTRRPGLGQPPQPDIGTVSEPSGGDERGRPPLLPPGELLGLPSDA